MAVGAERAGVVRFQVFGPRELQDAPFWIAWNSTQGKVNWQYGGHFGILRTLNGGVVWTTARYTWIWRAPKTPAY